MDPTPFPMICVKRVVAAVLGGVARAAGRVASPVRWFSVSSVVKWSQRYRKEPARWAPGPDGRTSQGGPLDRHRSFIVERISQTPHLTLHKLKDELAARGIHVSHNAVWLFSGGREGLRFKKKRCSPLSRPTPDVAPQAAALAGPWQARLDPRHLVFIDEDLDQDQHGPRFAEWGAEGASTAGLCARMATGER